MISWHRLFGLALVDYFAGSPWNVELETDLSLKQQFLDVIIVRRDQGTFSGRLPDGLEDLSDYNLLSYKSLREPLDDWVLKELTGHYVNYRKHVITSRDSLLPEEAFRLYGVSTRFPQKLAGQVHLEPRQPGVYQLRRGTDQIRIVVLNEVAEEAHNSIWHLFSAVPERVRRMAAAYRPRSRDSSTLLNQLFENYQLEGIAMPYTMEDFRRDFTREHLHLLTSEERLKGLSLNQIRDYLARLQERREQDPVTQESAPADSS